MSHSLGKLTFPFIVYEKHKKSSLEPQNKKLFLTYIRDERIGCQTLTNNN